MNFIIVFDIVITFLINITSPADDSSWIAPNAKYFNIAVLFRFLDLNTCLLSKKFTKPDIILAIIVAKRMDNLSSTFTKIMFVNMANIIKSIPRATAEAPEYNINSFIFLKSYSLLTNSNYSMNYCFIFILYCCIMTIFYN